MPLNWRMAKRTVMHLHKWVLLIGLQNDIMKFVGKWVEWEKNILGELSQTQKEEHDKYSLISR